MTPLIALALACAGNKNVDPPPAPAEPPPAAPAPSTARIAEVAGGTASRAAPTEAFAPRAIQFAKRFHDGLASPTENSATSGASAQFALGMLAMGAGGASADAFEALYGSDLDPVRIDDARALAAYNDTAGVELAVVDAVWHDEGDELDEAIRARLAGDYRANVGPLPLSRAPSEAKQLIDAWTSKNTNGMIDELFPLPAISGAKLVLANAIAFEGDWLVPFDAAKTEELPFATPSGAKPVPMMQDPARKLPFSSGVGYSAVMLPYSGETTSMALVLPEEGKTLADALDGLAADNLLALAHAPEFEVDLQVPRFSIESEHDLVASAAALGLSDVFAASYPGYGGLKVGAAIQKVKVKVDEDGTEAAAATGITLKRMAREPKKVVFHADRPFYFVIWHHETKTPVFVGQVVDP